MLHCVSIIPSVADPTHQQSSTSASPTASMNDININHANDAAAAAANTPTPALQTIPLPTQLGLNLPLQMQLAAALQQQQALAANPALLQALAFQQSMANQQALSAALAGNASSFPSSSPNSFSPSPSSTPAASPTSTAPPPNNNNNTAAAAVSASSPSRMNEAARLAAAYQALSRSPVADTKQNKQHLSASSSNYPTYQSQQHQKPAAPATPKRTVLSVVTSAYMQDDPTLAEDIDDFDPLQPSRASRGLPKNATELWKLLEAYFVMPNQKDVDFLLKFSFPNSAEVLAQAEEEANRSAAEMAALQALAAQPANGATIGVVAASSSAPSETRASRRINQNAASDTQQQSTPMLGAANPTTTKPGNSIDAKAQQRMELIAGLRNPEQNKEFKLRLEELLTQAQKTVEKGRILTSTDNESQSNPDASPAAVAASGTDGDNEAANAPLVAAPTDDASLPPIPDSAYARFIDSRVVCAALETALPIQTHFCSEDQIRILMHAVWTCMKYEQKHQFCNIQLPSDTFSFVLAAAYAFHQSLPPRPKKQKNNVLAAANPDGVEDEESEDEFDVDRLTLMEAEEMLEKLEVDNQATALRVQDRWIRYMLGTRAVAYPDFVDSLPSEASEYLKSLVEESNKIIVAPRNGRPFNYSLTGTFSRRANDRRRMDLILTKREHQCIDQWIKYVDKQEYWKLPKPDDEDWNHTRTGKGMGKGNAERVDSTYVAASSANNNSKAGSAKGNPSCSPVEEAEPDVVCCVCGDGDCEDDNQIIFCDRCDIAVHQDCYGVESVPEGEWYCSPCSMLISRGFYKQTPLTPQYSCAVCWQKGGGMRRLLIPKKDYKATLQVLNTAKDVKPPAQLAFAHVSCALFISELYVGNVDEMSPICGLQFVNPQRFKLKCQLCKKLGGACVQCADKKCTTAFHMQCALEHGLQMEISNDSSKDTGVSYSLYCDRHRTTPRINTSLKAVDGQVQGAQPQCQVCCYNINPVPLDEPNEMLACTNCNLQVHLWCYGSLNPKSASADGDEQMRDTNSSSHDDVNNGEQKSNGGEGGGAEGTGRSAQAGPVAVAIDPSIVLPVRKILCRVCEYMASPGRVASDPQPSCTLCLATQGALKRTVSGEWVCMPCTYFTPEVFFKEPEMLEKIDGVPQAKKARGKLACCICDRQDGVPVQCGNIRCVTAYHVSCAYAQGWEFRENPNNVTNCPFISYCGKHSKISASTVSSVTSNPMFANATFSSFTIPDADENDTNLNDESDGTSGGGGGSGSKKKKGGKRGRKSAASDDDDDDSDVIDLAGDEEDDDFMDDDAYKKRPSKSRPTAGSKWNMSGMGQMVFESNKKKNNASAGGGASSSKSKIPFTGGIGPSGKIRKVLFSLDNVPVHIWVANENTAAYDLPNNKRKFKSSESGVIKMDGDMADVEEGEDAEEEEANKRQRTDLEPRSPKPGTFRARRKKKEGAAAAAAAASTGLAPARTVSGGSSSLSRMPKAALPAEEEGPAELFCVCRQPYGANQATMIGCDGCEGWYHLVCLGIVGEEAQRITESAEWYCPSCAAHRNSL